MNAQEPEQSLWESWWECSRHGSILDTCLSGLSITVLLGKRQRAVRITMLSLWFSLVIYEHPQSTWWGRVYEYSVQPWGFPQPCRPCYSCVAAIEPCNFTDKCAESQELLGRLQSKCTSPESFNGSILFCLPSLPPPPTVAVLTLYFLYYLHWNEDTSTSVYHAFSSLCYFTPILGAAIADSWLGKFK